MRQSVQPLFGGLGAGCLVDQRLFRLLNLITSQQLKYRLTDDGHLLLYSVAWNESDDGGQVALRRGGRIDWENGGRIWQNLARQNGLSASDRAFHWRYCACVGSRLWCGRLLPYRPFFGGALVVTSSGTISEGAFVTLSRPGNRLLNSRNGWSGNSSALGT